VLGSERSGRHLCHAMLLPAGGRGAAAAARARRQGGAWRRVGASPGQGRGRDQNNPRFLNARTRPRSTREICVDIALLDRTSEIAVMRGAVVEHPKYNGRRVFGAGIKSDASLPRPDSFVWYLQRDLGW